jgi:Raf kinase inhibitor-like YbhB/YbcL family protein
MPTRKRATAATTALVIGLLLAGCSSDGKSLREPGTGGAVDRPPIVTTTAVDLFANALSSEFALASQVVQPATFLPYRFSLAGSNVSPPLEWQNVPIDTQELVLVVTDVTANGFVHWVIAGIDPALVQLFEGGVPPGAVQMVNDFGELGWGGPAPPIGDTPHSYMFRLFALGEFSGLLGGEIGTSVLAEIEEASIGVAELVVFYEHLDPIDANP